MESEFSRRRLAVCILVAVVIALAIFAVAHRRPWESTTARARRVCLPCGLGAAEVDRLIDDAGYSVLSREDLLRLWTETYTDAAGLQQAGELCGPCVEAVLDAAGE